MRHRAASSHSLPFVFVCDNFGFTHGTPAIAVATIRRSLAVESLTMGAKPMPGLTKIGKASRRTLAIMLLNLL
jgi:hypothetical protein